MSAANQLLEKWSRAHASFHEIESVLAVGRGATGPYGECFAKALHESPNGDLYHHSAFLEELSAGGKVGLGHVTFRLDDIRRSKALYASGGCLVGSPYFFPMAKEGSEYRLHNLGEYIYREETAGRGDRAPEVLLIEADTSAHPHSNLIGINYLRLGEIHFDIFAELSYLLSGREQFDLQRAIEGRVVRSLPFLKLCSERWLDQKLVEPTAFFRVLNETVPRLPVLGYAYFEVLAEYLMLYSDSEETARCRARGEVNNLPYKRLVFGLYPDNRRNFSLSKFNPTLTQVAANLEQQGCFRALNADHLARHVTTRLISMVNEIFFSEGGQERFVTNRIWDFPALCATVRPLLGHLIHRELRSFGRYPDFYFYFDQMKALQAWNYWNHMGVSVPFNGVFPKGEVGLNPADSELSFEAFRCRLRERDGAFYAEPIEKLDIGIAPRLVDLKYTLMRNQA